MFVTRLCALALRQHGARNPSARLLFNCADPWKRSTEGGVALEAPSVPEREGAPPPASGGAGEGRPFSSVTSLDRDCTYDVGCSSNIKWHESPVTRDAREKQLNQRGCVLWMTGLSGSGKVRSAAPRRVPSSHVASPRLTPLPFLLGPPFSFIEKSTVAFTLEHMLQERGKVCYVLDGDNLRHGLNHDLGFTPACREENIRRIGEVAKIMSQAGVITVVAIISPFAKDRDR